VQEATNRHPRQREGKRKKTPIAGALEAMKQKNKKKHKKCKKINKNKTTRNTDGRCIGGDERGKKNKQTQKTKKRG